MLPVPFFLCVVIKLTRGSRKCSYRFRHVGYYLWWHEITGNLGSFWDQGRWEKISENENPRINTVSKHLTTNTPQGCCSLPPGLSSSRVTKCNQSTLDRWCPTTPHVMVQSLGYANPHTQGRGSDYSCAGWLWIRSVTHNRVGKQYSYIVLARSGEYQRGVNKPCREKMIVICSASPPEH